MTDPRNAIEQAIGLHREGRLEEAARLYEAALQLQPDHFDALHLMGVVRAQQADHRGAVDFIARALARNPASPDAHFNLGNALQALRRHDEALASYDRALALRPGYADAHCRRGNVLRALQRPADALASFDAAIALEPDHVEALFARANALKALHRLDEALAGYDTLLACRPGHAEGLYNRGNALLDLERPEAALESFDRVLAVSPRHAEALMNRGNALRSLQRPEDALASYDRALAIRPDFADALNNRGNALLELGRFDAALASYDAGLALRPQHVETLINRANALKALARLDDALAGFERAIALRPEAADAHNNRGNVLQLLERHDDALASYDRALQINPADAGALSNRGNALHALHRHAEALQCFDRALAIQPDFADAHSNRGSVLDSLKRHAEAIACYDRALEIRPGHANALYNRGNALVNLERREEALACYDRVLALSPGYKYALGAAAFCRAHLCDWNDFSLVQRKLVDGVRTQTILCEPLAFLAVSPSPADQLACAAACARDRYPAARRSPWKAEQYRHARIRVAYLSADFREHPVAQLAAGLFEQHDRARFEIFGVSFGPDDRSAMRARLVRGFERFIDVRTVGDTEVAKLLRDAEIDIAVDLMGYTKNCRTGIFARRAAPVQVNYLGYAATMGAPYIDYLLADEFIVPPAQRIHCSEQVVTLPCFQVNDAKRLIAARAPTRAEAGLPASGFVFCCFNNSYKFTPAMFDIWMRLLHAADGSVLWLLQGGAAMEANLRREAAGRGVDPGRLVFAPRVRPEEFLARLALADLFLDTLPVNAGATASDALRAGVPLLTCAGEAMAARMAGSLLHAVGLPEMVTGTLAEYEALALALAAQPDRLREIRQRLARNLPTALLFDTARFRRAIEAAYTTMWEISQRGEGPKAFAVPA